ncbi:MAG: beta-galactosidase [Bacteroidales bacterium]|nr:beta-galactosidase [Bacteroidales bacterium]
MKTIITAIFISIKLFFALNAQSIRIDARIMDPLIQENHLKMGNPGPKGKELIANSKYLTLGGKPIIPVMGEIHYSRIPRDKWEDIILKAKANGINIIATYVFWIHHEEVEGLFDWSGNKDLRAFIELCQKHDLWVYPRIGPWCHGEVRNGGIPDWVLKKEGIKIRSNDPQYQKYAENLYAEIGKQLQGLYYKVGGPIIGIQLENEYWRGKGGEEHILWLKQTAIKQGMDVPLYTVTGWRTASVPALEVIPLWGAYPTAPWTTNINKIENNEAFCFEAPVNDEKIGHKENTDKYIVDYTPYPYFTCELGVGNQISYHRRPIINSLDGLAIALSRTGSGSNLPGYYVFAGGSNPVGTFTTLEEDQLETGYWNEYPDISYDFQAAIRETGELAPSYNKIKLLHYFLNEYGDRLAPMSPVIPRNVDCKKDLQYALRVKDDAGFLFVSNYYRGIDKPVQKGVQFTIQLKDEELTMPSNPVDIFPDALFIWPFNFQMDEVLLKYGTAQPLCRLDNENSTDWFFYFIHGVDPELCLEASNITSVTINGDKVPEKDRKYLISDKIWGSEKPVIVETSSGKKHRIFLISVFDADMFWLFNQNGEKYAFESSKGLYMDKENMLHAFGTNAGEVIIPLCPVSITNTQGSLQNEGNDVLFPSYKLELPKIEIGYKLTEERLFWDAQWLKVSVENIENKNALYHCLFNKKFELSGKSDIRKAYLIIFSDEAGKVRINGRWVNQEIFAGDFSKLDITGYVSQGENDILLDFPCVEGSSNMIAELDIEYFTSERVKIVSDTSWTTKVQYTIPAPWESIRKPEKAELSTPSSALNIENLPVAGWKIVLDTGNFQDFENIYLRIDYTGDKARCYSGGKLIADNFNNLTTWSINLKDVNISNGELFIEIVPLSEDYRIYFEEGPNPLETGVAKINSVRIEPEYRIAWKIETK